MSQQQDDLICVGHILGAQGLKGWVRIFSRTSPRDNIVNYSPWIIEQGDERKEVSIDGRSQGKNVIARLEGCEDRSAAEALTGCQILIRPEQLPGLQAGDYYWSDLIGLKVESLQGESLGVVASMFETGAVDGMVLNGDRDRLIKFVIVDIVHEVDLERKRLVVDWMPDY
jgi:16S rRNA processing protein RimM